MPLSSGGILRVSALGAVCVVAVTFGSVSGTAAPLTPEEQRGRHIYVEGESPGEEPVTAYVGRSGVRMPASVLPCASCHGEDGLGRPEGGVEPSNITWSNLTTSYGHQHQNGRRHAAFDEDGLALAITGQVDPAGNRLDVAMPRYEMSEQDLAALIAYIKRLEFQRDPGLSDTAIRIGTLLPNEGGYAPIGQAVDAVTRGFFDDVNAAGGIFGRKLELVAAEYSDDPAETTANARRLVEDDGGVFAVLSGFALGVEPDVFPVFADAGVPQVDPFTLFAGHGDFPDEQTFFLLSGLPDQARALTAYAAKHVDPAPQRLSVIIPPVAIYDDVARAVQDEARRYDLAVPTVLRLSGDPRGIAQAVTELSRSGVDGLIYFGDTRILARLAAEAEAGGWRPRLFLPGQTAGRAVFKLPEAFDGRVHLAYPNLPEDQSAEGREEFRALLARYELSGAHLASQVRALAAAKVLVEALRRAGRSLSRAALVRELEGLSDFDTGQLPTLSFAANRRVGARGAHVLTVNLKDRRFQAEEVWVGLD